jgi:hypothetical protein
MRALRKLRIGVRLATAFGLVGVSMLGAIAIGVWGQSAARAATAQLARDGEVRRDALVAKFRTADFAGWQTGDTLRGVPGATEDTVGQRKEFLASTGAFRDDLARLNGYALPGAARQAPMLTNVTTPMAAATRTPVPASTVSFRPTVIRRLAAMADPLHGNATRGQPRIPTATKPPGRPKNQIKYGTRRKIPFPAAPWRTPGRLPRRHPTDHRPGGPQSSGSRSTSPNVLCCTLWFPICTPVAPLRSTRAPR